MRKTIKNKQSVENVINIIKNASKLEEKRDSLMKSINTAKGELERIKDLTKIEVDDAYKKQELLKKILSDIEKKQSILGDLDKKIISREVKIVDVNSTLSVEEDKLKARITELNNTIGVLEGDQNNRKQDILVKENKAKTLSDQIDKIKISKSKELKRFEMETDKLAKKVSDYNKDLIEIKQKIVGNKQEFDNSVVKLADFQSKKEEYARVKSDINDKKKNLGELTQQIEKKEKELKSIDKSKAKEMDIVDSEKVKLASMSEQLKQKEQSLIDRENRLNTLRNTLKKHLKKFDIPINI